jgi:tungstate transport system ATP-binding protein
VSLLRIDGIEVSREGRTILSLPRLDVRERELLVVLGPTGAGKSTLLRVLHFLERPTSGTLSWRNETVAWPAPLALRRRISMAFQDPLLLSGSTYDNVVYGLRLRGQNGSGARERVQAALRLFHVEHLSAQRARTLSGGEAQRTALARALVLSPELLLLDEPFAALDAPIRKHLLDELRQVLREHGITCVYVTHEQSEAFSIADRIAILNEGRLLQTGSPEEVLYHPTSRAVATFMQTGNLLPGVVARVEAGLAHVDLGARTLSARGDFPEGTPVLACLRPEEVLLGRADPGAADPAINRLDGRVASVEDLGATLLVRVDCGLGHSRLQALITRRAARDLSPRPGENVVATFAAASVHLLRRERGENGDDL